MFDFAKIAEFEARAQGMEAMLTQALSIMVNIGNMVQQIHAHHVVAAQNGGKVDQVISTVTEVAQIAGVVAGVAATLVPAQETAAALPTPVVNVTHG